VVPAQYCRSGNQKGNAGHDGQQASCRTDQKETIASEGAHFHRNLLFCAGRKKKPSAALIRHGGLDPKVRSDSRRPTGPLRAVLTIVPDLESDLLPFR